MESVRVKDTCFSAKMHQHDCKSIEQSFTHKKTGALMGPRQTCKEVFKTGVLKI
jgi:hypothetical protein